MPVLPQEPFVFPEDLFSEESGAAEVTVEGPENRWWVLQTRPRSEKALARRLYRQRLSFFLPLHERRRRIQRRLVRSHLPLFPNYLFVCSTEYGLQAAYSTNFLVNCLHVARQEQLFDDLARIYTMIVSGAPIWPEQQLQPGMPAEIVSGPLAGHTGRILRVGPEHDQKLKFVVAVDFLQQGAALELDESMVRAV